MSIELHMFLLLAVPAILGVGARWFVTNGDAAKVLAAAAFGAGAIGMALFVTGRIQPTNLVAFLAPAFQVAVARTVVNRYRARFGRDMILSTWSPVLDPDRRADARLSTLLFAIGIGVPLAVSGILA